MSLNQWRAAVASGATQLGYQEWVSHEEAGYVES
jgi:hypothetical protein